MSYKTLAAVTVAAGLLSAPAMAVPGGSPAPVGSTSAVEQIHYSHSSCQRGPAGWHYHHRGARYVCGSRPSGNHWGWTFRSGRWGWWHSRERRWH